MTRPERTCEALIEDETKDVGQRVCGAPASVHVIDRSGDAVDEFDCCSDCTPWQEPMDGITVEAIEEAKR